MSIAMFSMPGGGELLLILFVVLLLFGAKKLPELSRSLGKSLSEFKKGKEEGEKSLNEVKESAAKLPETKETDKEKEKSG